MIERLQLTNFKCFNHANLNLNRLTILTGANATGKSTIIQALLLAARSDSQEKTELDINQIFGFAVGAPNALVSQNPVDGEEYNFAFDIQSGEGTSSYQYVIDKQFQLKLNVKKEGTASIGNFQYLNAERVGPRISNQAGKGDGITFNGENAAYLIEMADQTEREIAAEMKIGQQVSNKFSYFVENWMSAILGDLRLDIHTDYVKAVTELRIKNNLVDTGVVPTLTGFGISYVLPVIVAGLWATSESGAVLVLENPEAHLHPYAQSNMGKFLALLAACGVQVIVETHSEHIIDGARCQLAKMGQHEEAIVNFMENENGSIRINPISVNERGELSSWPKGFFDQKQNDLRDIFMLRRKHV